MQMQYIRLNLNRLIFNRNGFFSFWALQEWLILGTGVNSQIIGTSTFWRFEFISGMVLLSLAVPLNYYLGKAFWRNWSRLFNLNFLLGL